MSTTQDINDRLLNEIIKKNRLGVAFWVVIDNEIIKFKNSDDPLYAWVVYSNDRTERDANGELKKVPGEYILKFGREEHSREFYGTHEDPDALAKIEQRINNITFGGYDFNIPKNFGRFNVDIDSDLNIIFIKTQTLMTVLRAINKQGSGGKINMVTISPGDGSLPIEISAQDFAVILHKLAEDLTDKYKETAYKYIWKRLKRKGVFKTITGRLLLSRGVFIPITIQHYCLINPLEQFESVNRAYTNSRIYKSMLPGGAGIAAHKLNINKVNIYFLTRAEISSCLNLNSILPMVPEFYFDLITGLALEGKYSFKGKQVKMLTRHIPNYDVFKSDTTGMMDLMYGDELVYRTKPYVYTMIYRYPTLRKYAKIIDDILTENDIRLL